VLSGTAEAGSTVEVFDGGAGFGTATADKTGNWSFTTSALTDGSHAFNARATDEAGNTGLDSGGYRVTINTGAKDTTPPFAPTIDTATDNAGPKTGPVADGGKK